MDNEKFYLVQLKLGEYDIRRYVVNDVMLQYLQNDLTYDYVRVIKEVTIENINESKIKRKTKK